MAPEEICKLLKDTFGDAIEEAAVGGGHPYARVAVGRWLEVAKFLRDDSRLSLNFLRCISAIDLLAEDKLACVYDLYHVPVERPMEMKTKTHEFAVRVVVERKNPIMPSVAQVWPAADWHEREAYDLMGITFTGHPDFRRILLPEDWEGHPLRKDYEFPLEYHGIPATTEFELTNPRH
ncbi:MAG: NADH-quinone oxidoreductase subunit C [Planctomycetes bacterium]|nr:NADH-quinone oxidoreductase subunit C [Planctomycetota bacterium]